MSGDSRKCGSCGKASPPVKCGRCKAEFYCDADCQKAAWPNHKGPCKVATAKLAEEQAREEKAKTIKEGKAFLEAKAKENGVVTLKSGLMYKVLAASTKKDAQTPTLTDPCECHYAGTLIDGREFDSSIKRGKPSTFAPNQVIKGWTEALQLMKEGDKWELYIPANLAYGDNPRPGGIITPGAVLVFTLELIKVVESPEKAGRKFLEAKSKEKGVVTLPSGLRYKVLKASTKADAKSPSASTPCECKYRGTLIDGKQFDASETPITFAPNQVIKGWTEAMQLMKEGDYWELYIPSDLAYGPRGSPPDIPGGATLVFTLELVKCKGK